MDDGDEETDRGGWTMKVHSLTTGLQAWTSIVHD